MKNADELAEFLADARLNAGYESREPLKFGKIRILSYCRDGFCFVDVYEGNEEFEGRVFVKKDDLLIWQLEYRGGIILPEFTEIVGKIYDEVLKPALREFPRYKPWKRGPDYIVIGEYEYYNECKGDISEPRNWEKIIHTTSQKEIYSYSDKGKLVQPFL